MITGYFAPIDKKEYLRKELKNITQEYDRLFVAEGPVQNVHWAQNIWFDVQILPFTSISDAARKLKQLQRLWSFYPYKNIRRGELISAQLPYFSPKPISFPTKLPEAPLGCWTLLDANTLLAAAVCSSPFSQGEMHFIESKVPPSRAYLKLWEVFTRLGKMPKPSETCLEVGASPGSWTWVLQQLGANVIAVDRAALAPAIAKLPRVRFLQQDAFSLTPKDLPKVDWIFSDVICYPEKLLEWIKIWLKDSPESNFVCTIKFQGEEGHKFIEEFEQIEGSQIVHLFHNKHELTWIRLRA